MSHSSADVIWVLASAILVFLMQAGFMCLEMGLVRQKNSINVAVKNMTDFVISSVAFFLVGFAVMFGTSYHGLIGVDGWSLTKYIQLDQTGWIFVFWFFQCMFCGAAATIVSGGVAERMNFKGYMIMSGVLSILIYPVFGHWVWGGAYELAPTPGWLNALGYKDFAGSSVVHMVGGVATLACLFILGPRKGKYNKDGSENKIWGSNIPISMLGTFLLWFGWFGFNAGSALGITKDVPLIIINTNLAACAGALSCLFFTWKIDKQLQVESVMNGALGGLVAITASCAYVTPVSALIIGLMAGPVLVLCSHLMGRFHIDDAVGAVPVHAACGILGIICVGLFAKPEFLINGSRIQQLGIQSLGVLACIFFTFTVAWSVMKLIDRFIMKLRVTSEDEDKGLNVTEHGARTLWLEMAQEMHNIEVTNDLSRRVMIEPHTEAGTVAAMFNKLMDTLQRKTKEITNTYIRLLKTEKKTAEMKDKMIHAEKMSAVGQLASGVAHEINNPLGVILGFSQTMKTQMKGGDPMEMPLSYIEREALRCKDLVKNLLVFSRKSQKDTREETDISSTTAEALSLVSTQVPVKSIQLVQDLKQNLPKILANKNQIQQIIINLCNNAMDVMPEGGTLTIRTGSVRRESTDFVTVAVSDTGCGIPDHVKKKIFEPFFTTKEVGKGTGLGLALIYEIVQKHKGTIEVESKVGEGTTFTAFFPVHSEEIKNAA